MKLHVADSSARTVLRWAHRALFACGVLLLGYCAFVVADTWVFQMRESLELESVLAARVEPPAPAAALIASDGLIGRIEIERLGVSAVVMEGTSKKTLRRAVGHIAGTALPGEAGNIAFSGHRDTFFRPLRGIRENDIITVTTPSGEFRYRVVSTVVVAPTDVTVLEPSEGEVLTLVTCYPFYYTGPAPERFIVRAERVS